MYWLPTSLNRPGRVGDDERHAGDEDEHHLLQLADAEEREGQRDQRRDRDVPAEDRQRQEEGVDPREAAAEHAQRDADERGQPEARAPRAAGVAKMLRVSARSNQRLVESCANVSAGLGSPLTARRSAPRGSPRVTNHHSAEADGEAQQRRTATTCQSGTSLRRREQVRASRRSGRCRRGGARCRGARPVARRSRLVLVDGIGLDHRRSCPGLTLMLLLGREDLDLDAAVLGVVVGVGRVGRAVPADASTLNRLGSSSLYFWTRASLTALARFSDSSLTSVGGTWPFIEPSVCPSMMIRAAPNCPASLAISSSTQVDVRIVQLLDVLAVHLPGDLLVQVPAVGKEVDDDRVGQDLASRPRGSR